MKFHKTCILSFTSAVTQWRNESFGGTSFPLSIVAALTMGLVFGIAFAETYVPIPLGYTLSVLAIWLLCLLGLMLGGIVTRLLLGRSYQALLATGVLLYALIDLCYRGGGEGYSFRICATGTMVALSLWGATLSLWKLVRHDVRNKTVSLLLCTSLLGVFFGGCLLLDRGFDSHYRAEFLSLVEEQESLAALESSLTEGIYTVKVMDYGTEDGIPSDTVSLSSYFSRGDDFDDYYSKTFLGYSLSKVPLIGRVWYPEEVTDAPLFVMAHGNHKIYTDSYLGYEYLGEYLASHGYVVASIDQNACNMMSGENDGRAVLLLEHIRLLLSYNKEAGNPLYGRIDTEQIAVGGHSRGGEIAATAYLFNRLSRYPERGNIVFDYGYHIKSIVAIAPTVNQYQPADKPVSLTDVNYLVLHGSDDRDVTGFSGMAQYENIAFTGEGQYLKSALYISGANHGQFNSRWGAYDKTIPVGSLLNTQSLLTEEEQQEIAKLFIKAFLDVTLKGDLALKPLLTDWDSAAMQLPQTAYHQCYEESGFTMLADFEEDADLETVTAPHVTASQKNLLRWMEELGDFDTGSDTHVLRLQTGSFDSEYALTMENPVDLQNAAIAFDVLDNDDTVATGEYSLITLSLRLTDQDGNTAEVAASDFATLFPAFPVRTDKLDFLFQSSVVKRGFSTVTVPTDAFSGIDLNAISEIALVFEENQDLHIDNIGYYKVN